jgi:hypothetical protein
VDRGETSSAGALMGSPRQIWPRYRAFQQIRAEDFRQPWLQVLQKPLYSHVTRGGIRPRNQETRYKHQTAISSQASAFGKIRNPNIEIRNKLEIIMIKRGPGKIANDQDTRTRQSTVAVHGGRPQRMKTSNIARAAAKTEASKRLSRRASSSSERLCGAGLLRLPTAVGMVSQPRVRIPLLFDSL